MSVFDVAQATLHADGNIGQAADYRRPPATAWTSLRVVLSSPTDVIGGLGATAGRSGTLQIVIRAADLASRPLRGDEFRLSGTVYKVEDVERAPLSISYRVTLSGS